MAKGIDLAGWPKSSGRMGGRIGAHDWSASPLGPIAAWPESLISTVTLMLDHRFAMAVLWGQDHRLLFNDAYLDLLGEAAATGLGLPLHEAWPQFQAINRPLLERVGQGRSVMLRDRHAPVRDGSGQDAWFDIAVGPLRDAAGAVQGTLVTVVETTKRVLAGRQLRAQQRWQTYLLKLSDGLRVWSDPQQVIVETQRMLGEELGADRVAFGEAYRNGPSVRFGPKRVTGSAPQVVGLVEYGPALLGRLEAGQTVVLPDVMADDALSEAEQSAFANLGVQAMVSVPLIQGGRLSACLVVHHGSPRHWTAAEIAMIETTAERAWSALDRAHAEQNLIESEELFRSFAQNSSPALWISTPDHSSLHFVNPAYEAIFGEDPGKMLSAIDRWQAIIHPEDRVITDAAVARLIQGFSVTAEYRIFRPADGKLRHVRDVGFPIRDAQDRIIYLAGIATDVTEQRRAEADLRASEERQRAILETARDYAILTMDTEGKVETWSKGAEAVLGWTAEEIIGQVVDLTFTPEDQAEDVPGWERRMARDEGQAPDIRWHLRKDGVRVFIDGMTRPLAGPDGTLRGYVKVGQDVTAHRATLQRLQASEAQFRQLAEAATSVVWIINARTLTFDYVSPAFDVVYGARPDEALEKGLDGWERLLLPEDRSAARAAINRVRAGERVTHEFRIRRPSDGEVRWIRDTNYPLLDGGGQVGRFAGIAEDVTELKRAEAAALENAERFRSLAEGIPQLVWRAAEDGAWTWASPQWTSYTGQSEAHSRGWGWLDPVHPDDRAVARSSWGVADESGVFKADYRIRDQATGSYRWFQTRAMPVRRTDGSVVEWLGTSTDVQDLRVMQARLETLVAEVQHRTRNLMSVITAVTDRTLATSPSLAEFSGRIRARLAALSRANGLLSRLTWDRKVTFDELLRTEVSALGVDASLISLVGPDGARLRSSTVQTLALVLHELLTNALGHGALAGPNGRVEVRWAVEEGTDRVSRLRIDWTETGQAPVPTQRDAFARELIERALPYQFSATTRYTSSPEGLECSMLLEILPGQASD